jgi:hypothetical protein
LLLLYLTNLRTAIFLFFLPPYSADMNRIEEQWHQLKIHEIAGQMFEDEYDLAMAVIQGMETRSQSGEYTVLVS